jgi:hypothetical protein
LSNLLFCGATRVCHQNYFMDGSAITTLGV